MTTYRAAIDVQGQAQNEAHAGACASFATTPCAPRASETRHFRRDATLVGVVGIAGAAAFSGRDLFNLDQTLGVPNGNSYATNDISEDEKRFQQLQASSGDAGRGGTATAGSGDPHSSGDGDAGGGGGGGGSGGVVADAGVNRSEPLTASRARPTARSQRNPYTPQYDFRRANRCYGVVACRLGFIFRS